MTVKLYIEGGGDGPSLDGLFREAWRAFFEAAGLVGRMPGVVRGKGRNQAFDMFVTAIRNPRPGVLPMLLVDSEDAVLAGHSAWQHVNARDNWDRPAGVTDRQAFLMVQVMETWLIADRELLRNYFGTELREAHLRAWPALEEVPKNAVLSALDQATAACNTPYSKGKISYEILRQLDPARVEAACPHAKILLDHLRAA